MTHRNRWIRMIAVVTLAVIGLAACSDDNDESSATDDTTGTETTEVESGDTSPPAEETGGPVIENFAFGNMTAPAGEVVTVTNQDGVPHTITADDESFDTGQIEAGGRGDLTAPEAPGTYAVHCEIHSSMEGELVVT